MRVISREGNHIKVENMNLNGTLYSPCLIEVDNCDDIIAVTVENDVMIEKEDFLKDLHNYQEQLRDALRDFRWNK